MRVLCGSTEVVPVHPFRIRARVSEGGRVLGKAAVRAYWKRQFEMLDSNVEPKKFTREADGRIAIDVHQVVHDKSRKLVVDQMVQHVYEFRDGLIQSMEIRP